MSFILYAKNDENIKKPKTKEIKNLKIYTPYANDDRDSYQESKNFKNTIPSIRIQKIFTTSTRNFTKYLNTVPLSFICHQYGFTIYFLSNNKLFVIEIDKKYKSTIQSIDIPMKTNIPGSIFVNKNHIILSLIDKQIFLIDHNLKIKKQFTHKYGIVSKILEHENKLYFIDISDSFVELDLSDYSLRFFTPDNLIGNFYNCIDNFIITEKYFVYGNTSSSVSFIDRKNFTLTKSVILNSSSNYIKNRPILFNENIVILTSDLETMAINLNNLEIVWKIEIGSFTQPILLKNQLILANDNLVFIFNLEELKIIKHGFIFFGINNYLLHTFIFQNNLFALDNKGHLHLINILNLTFQKCLDKLNTNHTPLIFNTQKECFISIMNKFGEMEAYILNITN